MSAPLTDAQLLWLHDELGEHSDDDLQDRHARLGTPAAVAASVLRARLAGLLAAPAQFSIPGVITTGTGDNIRALQSRLAVLDAPGGAADTLARTRPRARPRR